MDFTEIAKGNIPVLRDRNSLPELPSIPGWVCVGCSEFFNFPAVSVDTTCRTIAVSQVPTCRER